MSTFHCRLVALCLVLLSAAGCADKPPDAGPPDSDKMTLHRRQQLRSNLDQVHEHVPGIHGGIIITLGREEYHAEAVLEREGTIHLYTLGSDPTRVQEVDRQELTAYVKPNDGSQTTVIVLRPEPVAGDADGKTSQFVGGLPASVSGRSFLVSIPNLRISGERFRLQFPFDARAHQPEMPLGVAETVAGGLYLTPGGKYTEADIAANGSTTAARKYRGFLASHDSDPQPGEPLCPVTHTKANPECTWIIGGETYEFCCPPCIDEFLALAKESPGQVQAPETYVKK